MLVAASFIIALFAASLDPFLHLWDEQFHALVSKNLGKHFFKPTLYDISPLNYDYKAWSSNHIWLHKQPLFLWQMAISQLIFGHTELGARFPDIVMHAILTYIIYDMGKNIKNESVGFLAALFFTFMNFPLDLISGRIGLDHNDFAFMFYITLSFWAYFRYQSNQTSKWVILIGMFAGFAILVKWLVGLLVYLSWFLVYIIENKSLKELYKNISPIAISILTAFLVFMPWQVYCFFVFPDEFKYAMLYNAMHINQVLEGHGGDWTFYFVNLHKLYGEGDLVPFILLFSLIFFCRDKTTTINYKISIISAIIFIYLFFSVVKTKMTAFPSVVLPIVLIVLANFINALIDLIKNKRIYMFVYSGTSIILLFLFIDMNLILKTHTDTYLPSENTGRKNDILMSERIKSLPKKIDSKNTVIFNCYEMGSIKCMFYTDFIAYDFIPSQQDCQIIQDQGYQIAVIKDEKLPDYIENDFKIIKLNMVK